MEATILLDKAQIHIDNKQLEELCRKNNITYLGVFGSVARGEANEQSDLDLLVRFSKAKSLLSFIALEDQLAKLFPRRVDLLTDNSLSPYIRDNVLNDLQVLYESQ